MGKKKRNAVLDSIQFFFFMLGVRIIRWCSLRGAYRWARFVGWLFYSVDLKHRNRTIRHILHSGIVTDRKEAKKLALKSMIHMVKVFVEIIKFDQIVNEENFYEHIRIADNEGSQKLYNRETAVQTICAAGHIGNWELAGGALSFTTGLPVTSIMRPLGNEKLGNFFYKHRCGFGVHKTTSREKGLRPLVLAQKDGHHVAIVADQHANHNEGVEVTFFGHPARAHATPALLQLKGGQPLSAPCLFRLDDDFHFELYTPELFYYTPTGDKDADVQAICQAYTTTLEKIIRQHPDQWLWAHRRWLDIERRQAKDYKDGKKIVPEGENAK